MLTAIRCLLLIASAAFFAAPTYELWDRRPAPWSVYAIWLGLILNFVYLAAHGSPKPASRLFRIIGLWLEAKENELRVRTKREFRTSALAKCEAGSRS